MNWQALLAELRKRGWTQQQIAEKVGASQAAISDLKSGKTTNPAYSLGHALTTLHSSGEEPTRAAA